jgi:2-succinyl-5-enolpyruvyl-6-hydroxy-3-cyclohexene-1-carboxylate synthase
MLQESEAARTARVLVEELVASGVKAVCISPGSRSTPLTLAFADHPGVQVFSHIDERAGSFFALGLAKSSGQPVALVCTSGTAPANYFPAIIEASLSRVPLLVLSADRPPELHDCGANQTIHQQGLFGSYVRFAATVAATMAESSGEAALRRLADRAVAEACGGRPGPVHLNCEFREPFAPRRRASPEGGSAKDQRMTKTRAYAELGLRGDLPAEVIALLSRARRPLVVMGPSAPDGGKVETELRGFVGRIGAALFAEATANVGGLGAQDGRVDAYDALLRAGPPNELPDLVVRIGGVPTSRAAGHFLTSCAGISQIVLADSGEWPDPTATATHLVSGPLAPILAGLTEALPQQAALGAWAAGWVAAGAEARGRLDRYLDTTAPLEGTILRAVTRALSPESALFVGNSLAIRDLDLFCTACSLSPDVFVSRGASGIDGLVSTIFGIAAGHSDSTVGVLGDVSFLHDAGGLLAATRTAARAVLVVLDNDGGGIFDHLPLAHEEHPAFEDLFITSHGRSIAEISRAYGVAATEVSADAFPQALQASLAGAASHVLVVRIGRAESQSAHREVGVLLGQVPGWN